MAIVRYPGLVRTQSLDGAYIDGLEARGTDRTFLEVTPNKIILHLAVTIVEPTHETRIMNAGSIDAIDRPSDFARGLCALNAQPVFVRVNTAGQVDIDPQSPINLIGNDWLIGTVEWMRKTS